MHIDLNNLITALNTIERRLPDLGDGTIAELEEALRQAAAAVEAHREARRTAFSAYDADPRSCGHVHSYT